MRVREIVPNLHKNNAIVCKLQSLALRRSGRAVECARLESGYTARYRRFESCLLRNEREKVSQYMLKYRHEIDNTSQAVGHKGAERRSVSYDY